MKARDVIAWLRKAGALESRVNDEKWQWTNRPGVTAYLACNAGDSGRKIIYKVNGVGSELEISLYVNSDDKKVDAFRAAARSANQMNFVEWFENEREAGVRVRQRILCNRLPDFLVDSIREKFDQLYSAFGSILKA